MAASASSVDQTRRRVENVAMGGVIALRVILSNGDYTSKSKRFVCLSVCLSQQQQRAQLVIIVIIIIAIVDTIIKRDTGVPNSQSSCAEYWTLNGQTVWTGTTGLETPVTWL